MYVDISKYLDSTKELMWVKCVELPRPIFYYARNAQKHPIVTVCLLVLKEEGEEPVVSRGISICSPIEGVRKPEGRKRALKRAMHAIYTQCKADYPISRYEACMQIESTELDHRINHKSMYNCALTTFEMHLLEKLKLI